MNTHNTQKPATKADWNAIELAYRAGIKSLEQIGAEFGVTKGRISQVAKKQEWTRDLAAKIQARADARVNESVVNKELNAGKRLTETTIVTANAELQYRIRMEHRADIGRTRKLFQTLLAELELSCTQTEQIKALFDVVHPAPSGLKKSWPLRPGWTGPM